MRALSIALFLLGLLLATALTAIALWPDFEATLFDPALTAEESLKGLNCPLVITGNESAQITSTFSNPFERKVDFLVRTRISMGGVTLIRQYSEMVELEAGEKREVAWPIYLDDAAFGRIILARAYAFRKYPMPSRARSCGILVLDMPALSGRQFVGVTLALSLASLIAGAVIWLRHERPLLERRLELTRAAGALAGLILLALVASMLSWWVVGLFLLVLALLLLVAALERFFSSQ
jgi:hypothetical protein